MRRKTDYIVIHCSATPSSMNIGLEEINRWHKEKGWKEVGYHDVIRRDGLLEFGRDVNEVGAHVKGYNDRSVGICLVGGVSESLKPENNFTPAQFNTLSRCLKFYRALFPHALVVGHHDLNPNKDCPCFDVENWLRTEFV